jgi:hypothetical protein
MSHIVRLFQTVASGHVREAATTERGRSFVAPAHLLACPDFAIAYGRGEESLWWYFNEADRAHTVVQAVTESSDKKCARALNGVLSSENLWVHEMISGWKTTWVDVLVAAADLANTKPFVSNFLLNFLCHVLTQQFNLAATVFQCEGR